MVLPKQLSTVLKKCMPSSNTGTTSIGTPVSNIDLFIGNDSELLISGITLARGYLKKGAATAEKFIPNELASASRKSINSSKHDPPKFNFLKKASTKQELTRLETCVGTTAVEH